MNKSDLIILGFEKMPLAATQETSGRGEGGGGVSREEAGQWSGVDRCGLDQGVGGGWILSLS